MLGNVEIANLCTSMAKEYVGRFDISMDDVGFVELVQTLQALVGDFPNGLLFDSHFSMQVFFNFFLNYQLITAKSPSLAKSITTHRF